MNEGMDEGMGGDEGMERWGDGGWVERLVLREWVV